MSDALTAEKPKGRRSGKAEASAPRPDAAADAKEKRMLRLLCASPKGGVGKTGLARNLAVAAAHDGLRVIVADTDKQRSLSRWYEKRPEAAKAATPVAHFKADIDDVDALLGTCTDRDLMIIDTPTAIEEHPKEVKRLLLSTDFVLIPTGVFDDDIDSVVEWMRQVQKYEIPAAFVLNKVRRNAGSVMEAKLKLAEVGHICPFEIPLAEDIGRAGNHGLSILEIKGGSGAQEFRGVWTFVKSEMGF